MQVTATKMPVCVAFGAEGGYDKSSGLTKSNGERELGMSNDETKSGANHANPPNVHGAAGDREFIAELKRQAAQSRLPPDVKAEILKAMPSDEEMERLFREMQLKGGLTFEEFAESLGLDRG